MASEDLDLKAGDRDGVDPVANMARSYEPKNKLEEELLTSGRFDPANGSGVYLVAGTIVGDLTASVDEIEAALQSFESAGLVTSQVLSGVKGRAYSPQLRGYKAREAVLRSRGLRHPALVRQKDFSLRDLLVALVVAPHIWNARMTGSFLAAEPKMTTLELELYLSEYSAGELDAACSALVDEGLLSPTTKYGSDQKAFEATGRGRQAYNTGIAARLKVADGESILDHMKRSSIDVFFAWQSEYKASRNAIDSALEKVVKEINRLDGVSYPLRVVQATEPGEGAIRIDVALQEKIGRADFFVGDLTPVYAYGERLRVNENVLVEVGFALASMDPNQIVLVAMKRDEVPGDAPNAKPTFDIAHVRRQEFRTKDELRGRLKTELQAALKARGWLRTS